MSDTPAAAVPAHRGGHGEPMIMIHGLGGSWRNWAPIIPTIEEHHDVLALDLPGFGSAPPLTDGGLPTVPTYADWIEQRILESGLDAPHLVGNSMGGWIALELARRGVARSLTLISPAGVGTRTAGYVISSLVMASRRLSQLVDPFSDQLMRPPAVRSALLSLMYGKPDRISASEASESIRAFGRASGFDDAHQWLYDHRLAPVTQIDCPCLIMWGTRDRVLPIQLAPRYAERVPGSKIVKLPGLGHVPMSDDPDLVARTILDFTAPGALPPVDGPETSDQLSA